MKNTDLHESPWEKNPGKKPIGCSQLHRIGLPVFHRGKMEKCWKSWVVLSRGILSFLGNVSAYGPIFKGGCFSVRAGKMTKTTFYTPEVLQHSPYVSDKYPKGKGSSSKHHVLAGAMSYNFRGEFNHWVNLKWFSKRNSRHNFLYQFHQQELAEQTWLGDQPIE